MRRKIEGVTATFRFVKYGIGSEVAPHPDTSGTPQVLAIYSRRPSLGGDLHTPMSPPTCSLFTCLLYLNEGYEGCETHLIDGRLEAGDWPVSPKVKLVKPERGLALIFEHDVVHGCPPLRSNAPKLVLRVDILYSKHDFESGALLGESPYRDPTLKTPFEKFKKGILAKKKLGDSSLVGKTAIVTGSSSGVGLEIAKALAKIGMNVIGVSRTLTDIENVRSVSLDVRDSEKIDALFDELKEVTVLVNNAGIHLPKAVVRNGSQEACEEVFAVNTLAPLNWTRKFLQHLERRQATFGHIVNISSLSAHRLTSHHLGIYAASKHALKAITESTRLDLRQAKLPYRVTMISPGLIGDTGFFGGQGKDDTGTLKAKDVVDALLYVLQAPVSCEVHDILLRATTSRD